MVRAKSGANGRWQGFVIFSEGAGHSERNSPSCMFYRTSRTVYLSCGPASVCYSHSEIYQILNHTGVQIGNDQSRLLTQCKLFFTLL